MKKLITLGAAAALVFTMGTVVFGADINMTGENQGIRTGMVSVIPVISAVQSMQMRTRMVCATTA